jgi:hypothetical protein
MPAVLRLYRFRFRDPVTGRWTRARYRAALDDIRRRYAQWELDDDGEVRTGDGAHFSVLSVAPNVTASQSGPPGEPPVETAPRLAPEEVALATCFLRRYVTWCARRGRYAAMNGAARLLRELRASV